jgi:transcriptional regulator with XRE-family HTH domain
MSKRTARVDAMESTASGPSKNIGGSSSSRVKNTVVPVPAINGFAEQLKSRRVALGLTQMSVARRIGVVPAYVTQMEKGRRRPSLKLIARIADTLGVERQEMLFHFYPEAKELFTTHSEQGATAAPSWQSFINDQKLLARYHVCDHEIRILEGSFSGMALSQKESLAILILAGNMRES